MSARLAALSTRASVLLSGLLLGLCTASGVARGADDERVELPPWNRTPLPAWARSVSILRGDQPLRRAPDGDADRRGSAQRLSHHPLYGARLGPGCHTAWLHVGPEAWVCGDDVRLSPATPIPAGKPYVNTGPDGLPFRYFFTGRDGSWAYHAPEQVDVGEPAMSLEPGFAVAIVEERRLDGLRIGKTHRDLWVPLRDFGPARTFLFHGAELSEVDETIPVAWVVAKEARTYTDRGGFFALSGDRLERFTEVAWREEKTTLGMRYTRIDETRWVRSDDLRHPTLAPPPDEPDVRGGARWIDVDLSSQTLIAYEGDRPVFATLVSTGKGKTKGHPFETPKGVHRIWVKLLTTTMDNLEDDTAGRYWRIEDVPYVQFFSKGVGLHGAFWHRSFGHIRSHGCVNLAPLDAERLFWFTSPHVPNGWTAVLPSSYERGTVVRVR